MVKKVGKFIKKYFSIFLVLIAIFCYFFARMIENHNFWLEKYYSSSLNKWVIQGLSHVTGLVPFSIGELLVVGHVLFIPVLLVIFIFKIKNRKVLQFTRRMVSYVAIIYILFMTLWGFNYSRMSIAEIMDLEVTQATNTDELYEMGIILIERANTLRELVDEDESGVFKIDGGYQSVFERAHTGYEIVGNHYKELAGSYGNPKFIMLSKPMLYTGIVGIYFPFTSEANVNVATPILFTPVDTLHEMAHQRGFASEDEANYIAYITAKNHPDVDFQYSGTLSAVTSSVNALLRNDYERGVELIGLYSEGLIRDLNHYNLFWDDFDGEISDVAGEVNDSYLKGNGQTEGIKSYGRVVDLLLAHYRTFGEI